MKKPSKRRAKVANMTRVHPSFLAWLADTSEQLTRDFGREVSRTEVTRLLWQHLEANPLRFTESVSIHTEVEPAND